MNEQELRQALEEQLRSAGWKTQSVEQIKTEGTILRPDGSKYSEVQTAEGVQVQEAQPADALAEVVKDLMEGKSIFIYQAGKNWPNTLKINNNNTGLEQSNSTVNEPQEPTKPGFFARLFDRVAKFFNSRVESCRVYDQYLAEKTAFDRVEEEFDNRSEVDPRIREGYARARERAAQSKIETPEFEKAVVGAEARIKESFEKRYAEIKSQFSEEALSEFNEKMNNEETITLEEYRAQSFYSKAGHNAGNLIARANALVFDDPVMCRNYLASHEYAKENGPGNPESMRIKNYLEGTSSPGNISEKLRDGKGIGTDFVTVMGIAPLVNCTRPAEQEHFHRYLSAIANVRGHLNPETRLEDINYLKDLYVKNLGTLNDQLREVKLGDNVEIKTTPDALSQIQVLGTKLQSTAQMMTTLGRCLFVEGGISTPEMAANMARVSGIIGLYRTANVEAVKPPEARLTVLNSLSRQVEMAEGEPVQKKWTSDLINEISPELRAEVAQKASALSYETNPEPITARQILETAPQTLTPEDARNMAARAIMDRVPDQAPQQLQQMANRLAADPRFIEAAGSDPLQIAERVKSGELEKMVQKRAVPESPEPKAVEAETAVKRAEMEKAAEAQVAEQVKAAQAKPPVA